MFQKIAEFSNLYATL